MCWGVLDASGAQNEPINPVGRCSSLVYFCWHVLCNVYEQIWDIDNGGMTHAGLCDAGSVHAMAQRLYTPAETKH